MRKDCTYTKNVVTSTPEGVIYAIHLGEIFDMHKDAVDTSWVMALFTAAFASKVPFAKK
jgi:hypothetical protein